MMGSAGVMGPNGKAGNKLPSGYRQYQMQNYTPEQMGLFKQAFSHVGPESYLSKLASGDQSQFDQMEEPAMRQFSQMQGQMGSRFSGMGGTGSRKSSGFQNSANQASSDFAQDLAGRRQTLQRQAINDLMGMSNQLLGQKPYDQGIMQKQQKEGFNWGGLAGGAIGGVGGFLAGGPMGAISGAGMGYNMGSGLSGKGGGNNQVSMPNFSSLGGLGGNNGGGGGMGGMGGGSSWGGMGGGSSYSATNMGGLGTFGNSIG